MTDTKKTRRRGRPLNAGTKDRPLRRSLTMALCQCIMKSARPDETATDVEKKLCVTMDKEDVVKIFGSGGSGKRMREFLAGRTPLNWDTLATLTKDARSAGYLPIDDDETSAFLNDLESPAHFSQAIEARRQIVAALCRLHQASVDLFTVLERSKGLAQIDQEPLSELRSLYLQNFPTKSMEDVKDAMYIAPELHDFQVDKLMFQIGHLSVKLSPGALRARIPTQDNFHLRMDSSSAEAIDGFFSEMQSQFDVATNLAQRKAKIGTTLKKLS